MGRGCPSGRVKGIAFWAGLSFAGVFAASSPTSAAETSDYSVRWNTNSNPTEVEVAGLGGQTLRQLQAVSWQTEDWPKLLSVYAGQGDFMADMKVPAMLGRYQVANGLIRFQPQFPLERGVIYRAVFRPAKLPGHTDKRTTDIVSRFQLPAV